MMGPIETNPINASVSSLSYPGQYNRASTSSGSSETITKPVEQGDVLGKVMQQMFDGDKNIAVVTIALEFPSPASVKTNRVDVGA